MVERVNFVLRVFYSENIYLYIISTNEREPATTFTKPCTQREKTRGGSEQSSKSTIVIKLGGS